MSAGSHTVSAVGVLLIAVILAGLIARRRAASCWTFVAYLVAVGAAELLMGLWPQVFWRRPFWIAKENLHNFLKLAIALELLVRIFHSFPSAYVAARRAMLIVLVGLAALIWGSLSKGADYVAVVGRLHPQVNDFTAWVFIALAGYCLWYHLPLDSLHKAILIGLVPYLLVYSVAQRTIAVMGWERGWIFNRSAPVVYVLLLAYWAYVVWRPAAVGDAGTRVGRLMSARQ